MKKETIIEPSAKQLELINRRKFLQTMATTGLLVSTGSFPLSVYGRSLRWSDIKYVLQLNFVRFLSGLVFDVAQVVLVDYLTSSYHSVRYLSTIPSDKENFNNFAYKKAVIQIHPVRYGMSEKAYNAYRAQRKQLVLSREQDLVRFETIHRHLVDNQIRIAFVGDKSSRKITSEMDINNLFATRYIIFRDDNAERHYQALLEKTEVSVFNNLLA